MTFHQIFNPPNPLKGKTLELSRIKHFNTGLRSTESILPKLEIQYVHIALSLYLRQTISCQDLCLSNLLAIINMLQGAYNIAPQLS